jgi:tetratricopeptide (TPR) repeat protein
LLGFLGIYTWKKNPAYTFGVLWFLIMMFPISGIAVPVAGFLYEHYLYAPLIGISFIIGLAGFALYKKLKNRMLHVLLASLAIIYFSFLIIQTNLQNNKNWKDEMGFYLNTLYYVPSSMRIRNGLGILYANQGNFEKAEETYRMAVFYEPKSPVPHHNLGNLFYRTGKLEEAIKEYKTAIQIAPGSPPPYQALYRLYLEKQEPENAEKIMKEFQSFQIYRN